jgi:hypothetical protein
MIPLGCFRRAMARDSSGVSVAALASHRADETAEPAPTLSAGVSTGFFCGASPKSARSFTFVNIV